MVKLALTEQEKSIILAILQQHIPSREVWAFGSRVKGTHKPFSDLDLAIIGNQPLSLDEHAILAEAFDDAPLNFKTDILDWAITSESFRQIVQQKYVVLQKPNAESDKQ
ncbi:nucleotidyltransferase domain-containing protein [Bibersteinia trehalosi]|uniref:nucleotidyltransferase family protein n=1 Tax=Bibersteinia trehalosi TaxID=47735 RepID=UPI003D2C73D9